MSDRRLTRDDVCAAFGIDPDDPDFIQFEEQGRALRAQADAERRDVLDAMQAYMDWLTSPS